MNDIQVFENNHEQGAVSRGNVTMQLGQWAESARAAHEVATILVQTSFVPEQFRNNASEATAAILAGAERGMSPMAALNAFDIIKGKAAPSALALRGIVQSYGHEIVVVESTSARAIVKGRRNGSNEWSEITWTMDRATRLGLTGKQNWKQQPTAMLLARATAEVARLIGADAILGIGYSAEELRDGVDTTAPEAAAKPSGTRTMKRPELVAVPEPKVDEAVDVPVVDETDLVAEALGAVELASAKQIKLINTLASGLGLSREQKLDGASRYAGRTITSTKELTKSEATDVIAALQNKVTEVGDASV